jgi:hypothetical protein
VTRDELVALLGAHGPADAEEARDLERMQDYAVTLEYPFSRDQPAELHPAEWIGWDDALAQIVEPALRRGITKARGGDERLRSAQRASA